MAAALRSELDAGDRCPVCGQDVGELEVGRSAGLDDAEAAVVAAKASATTADATLKRANEYLTTATAAAAAARARREEATATAAVRSRELEEARTHHAAASKAVVDTLGAGDPLQILAKRRRRLDDADFDAAKAADALDGANEAKAAAEADAEKRRRAMSRLATEVAALGGSLGVAIEVEAGRESLGSALESLWELWEARSAAAEDAVKEAARLLEGAIGDRADLHRDLGVDGDFATARSEAAAAAAAAANKVELLTERVGRVEALEKENEATLARHGVYARIADDLAPSKFLAYLLDEERVTLAELAAERFEMLSGGRYRFSEDGTFDVLDLAAAEAVRKPRSLSGGETFLASLALALALAEMVSRSGGRLEAFFLDEGFGSLDPEHLDLAMEGIERIVADDRLVLVVSHVAELRHRLEDLIELSKHPVTGDTVVVRA
jgi:exonuclease SbcC